MREQQSLDKHLLNDFNSMTVFVGDKILTILVRIEMKRYVYFLSFLYPSSTKHSLGTAV